MSLEPVTTTESRPGYLDLYYDNGEPDEIIDLQNWFQKDFDDYKTYHELFPPGQSAAEGYLYIIYHEGNCNIQRVTTDSSKQITLIPFHPIYVTLHNWDNDFITIRINASVDHIEIFPLKIYSRPPQVKPATKDT
jgi:ribosomal 30S subunit maturation factor RimM